jgi:16S rRNA (uracil1498-N3)-methyltransferase
MTRRRWIADEVSGNRAALIGEHACHLVQVLRAKVGQKFEISADGHLRLGVVSSIHPDRIEFDLKDAIPASSSLPITVALSIFKFDRMEWALEKCTELGVARITPLIAARTEPRLASASSKRLERWRRLAHQASEQSRRIAPPEIPGPIKLPELLKQQTGTRIVLSEAEEGLMLKDVIPPNPDHLTLAFGPEGGWKEQELAAFSSAGWTPASLGPTILRSETAVIAAVAVCQSVLLSVVPDRKPTR